MGCTAKHTKYQPTNDEFRCPKCGAGPEDDPGFIIESPADENYDCELLHDEDFLACFACLEHGVETEMMGKQFVRQLLKKKNLVPCPCCKGSGFVQKGKERGTGDGTN